MSGSNWRIIVAAGLAAFAVAAGLLASATFQQLGYQQTANGSAQNYAHNSASERELCDSRVESERPACRDEAVERAREGQRKEYDLEAQRITAVWTQHMGIAAIIGMAVSIVGVGLVWTTFAETRQANRIATNADRPWLGFKPGVNATLRIEGDTLRYDMSVQVTNYGVRPAIAVSGRIRALLDVSDLGDMREMGRNMFLDPIEDEHFTTVFAGQAEDVHLAGSTSITGLNRAETRFVISIRYSDPSLNDPLYVIEAFEMHANAPSSFGRDGDRNKLVFHGHPNTVDIVTFEIYSMRERPGVVI